jgi:hypothetical protein
MWCPTPLPKGEQHRRKLRSDKYKPPAGRLLEAYKSDSLVEADEDTDAEAGTDPDAGGAVKSRRRTRSTVRKKSASAVAAAISAVKAAEQKKKKKRKRKVASPLPVATPSILTPRSREVESEEEEEEEEDKEKDEAVEELPVPEELPARRSESPAAGASTEDVRGCPPAWFGGAAHCCHGAGEDACDDHASGVLAEDSAPDHDEVKS